MASKSFGPTGELERSHGKVQPLIVHNDVVLVHLAYRLTAHSAQHCNIGYRLGYGYKTVAALLE